MFPTDTHAYEHLRNLLEHAQHRAKRQVLLETLFWILAFLLLLLPFLALAARRFPALSRGALGWALILAGGAFGVFGMLRARRRLGPGFPEHVAASLDSPTLQSGLVPALELGSALQGATPPAFSPELAQAHLESVAAATLPEFPSLDRALPRKPLRRARGVMLALLALDLIAGAIWHKPLGTGFQNLLTIKGWGASTPKVLEPVTGEIELTYHYPAHTHLPARIVPNTNGEISAPPGTTVSLTTRADRVVGRAVVEVGPLAQPLTVSGGRLLSGAFTVTQPGSYRFRFYDSRNKPLVTGPAIPITLESDQPPKIELLAPAAELEIEPDSEVTLKYEAEDDFGLSELALVYKLPGATKAERIILEKPEDSPRRRTGEYLWPLRPQGLAPGDRVAYYLEAVDNDEVSGKKTATSRTQTLKVYSDAEHHRELLEQLSRHWERMVLLLADRLEAPERPSVDHDADALALDLIASARGLTQLKRPTPFATALLNIGQKLQTLAQATARARAGGGRHLAAALDAETVHEEQSILYLETLLDQQRIVDLVSLSKELASKRRDLASLLEHYRNAPDDATRRQLMNELAHLKERMGELAQRMRELSRGISDEHVNAEALKEMNASGKMFDTFDAIQDKLNKGEVADAMKEMEQLGQLLDTLQSNLQEASSAFRGGEFGETAGQMRAFQESLDALEKEQQGIVSQTQTLRQGSKKELEQTLEKAGGDALLERLRRQVKEARHQFEQLGPPLFELELEATTQKLQSLDQALQVGDLNQALESVQEALVRARRFAHDAENYGPSRLNSRNLEHAPRVVPPLTEIEQSLSSLLSRPRSPTEGDRRALEQLAKQQAKLHKEARRLEEQMSRINQQAPIFPPEAQDLMQGAGSRMEKAGAGLEAKNATRGLAEGRAALDQLGQLKQGLQKMGQGQGKGAPQAGGTPIPWPWMSPSLRPMPGPGGREEGNGNASPDEQQVQIPRADQFQTPEQFRKDVLDAMKQASPERYREQVKRYYEEIVK